MKAAGVFWPAAFAALLGSSLPRIAEATAERRQHAQTDIAPVLGMQWMDPYPGDILRDSPLHTLASPLGNAASTALTLAYARTGDAMQTEGNHPGNGATGSALEHSFGEGGWPAGPMVQFRVPKATPGEEAPPVPPLRDPATADGPQVEPTGGQRGQSDTGEAKASPADDASARTDNPPPETEGATQPSGSSMAQFQLPQPDALGGPGGFGGPQRPVTQFLKYQYSFGSESDATYRREPDLDKRLRDDSLILAPQINGYIIYRPNDRVETLLEMLLEREIPVREEKIVTLPSGETQVAPKRRVQLAVDQALITFKRVGPFDLTFGRRNFEDERHWLYDTSLDSAFVRLRQGSFLAEASVSRKDLVDLDFFQKIKRGRINNYMLYGEYRGIEDIKLAAYTIFSRDSEGREGRPLHMGMRAYGMPTDYFNFWADLGLVRGKDELSQTLKGRGFDIGATYRFLDLPLYPSVTLGYAYGSGDGNPDDRVNQEFRQTGLQSNEWKGAGVSKFKYYGEALDPELSNIKIFTASVGFRPKRSVYVDLVYHKYRMNHTADHIRNWALTAQMNQDDTQLSKDIGSALDVVLGFRNVFGIRRLGVDLRAGLFFPGKAFRNDVTVDPEVPQFRRADKGLAVIAKFWW